MESDQLKEKITNLFVQLNSKNQDRFLQQLQESCVFSHVANDLRRAKESKKIKLKITKVFSKLNPKNKRVFYQQMADTHAADSSSYSYDSSNGSSSKKRKSILQIAPKQNKKPFTTIIPSTTLLSTSLPSNSDSESEEFDDTTTMLLGGGADASNDADEKFEEEEEEEEEEVLCDSSDDEQDDNDDNDNNDNDDNGNDQEAQSVLQELLIQYFSLRPLQSDIFDRNEKLEWWVSNFLQFIKESEPALLFQTYPNIQNDIRPALTQNGSVDWIVPVVGEKHAYYGEKFEEQIFVSTEQTNEKKLLVFNPKRVFNKSKKTTTNAQTNTVYSLVSLDEQVRLFAKRMVDTIDVNGHVDQPNEKINISGFYVNYDKFGQRPPATFTAAMLTENPSKKREANAAILSVVKKRKTVTGAISITAAPATNDGRRSKKYFFDTPELPESAVYTLDELLQTPRIKKYLQTKTTWGIGDLKQIAKVVLAFKDYQVTIQHAESFFSLLDTLHNKKKEEKKIICDEYAIIIADDVDDADDADAAPVLLRKENKQFIELQIKESLEQANTTLFNLLVDDSFKTQMVTKFQRLFGQILADLQMKIFALSIPSIPATIMPPLLPLAKKKKTAAVFSLVTNSSISLVTNANASSLVVLQSILRAHGKMSLLTCFIAKYAWLASDNFYKAKDTNTPLFCIHTYNEVCNLSNKMWQKEFTNCCKVCGAELQTDGLIFAELARDDDGQLKADGWAGYVAPVVNGAPLLGASTKQFKCSRLTSFLGGGTDTTDTRLQLRMSITEDTLERFIEHILLDKIKSEKAYSKVFQHLLHNFDDRYRYINMCAFHVRGLLALQTEIVDGTPKKLITHVLEHMLNKKKIVLVTQNNLDIVINFPFPLFKADGANADVDADVDVDDANATVNGANADVSTIANCGISFTYDVDLCIPASELFQGNLLPMVVVAAQPCVVVVKLDETENASLIMLTNALISKFKKNNLDETLLLTTFELCSKNPRIISVFRRHYVHFIKLQPQPQPPTTKVKKTLKKDFTPQEFVYLKYTKRASKLPAFGDLAPTTSFKKLLVAIMDKIAGSTDATEAEVTKAEEIYKVYKIFVFDFIVEMNQRITRENEPLQPYTADAAAAAAAEEEEEEDEDDADIENDSGEGDNASNVNDPNAININAGDNEDDENDDD